MGKILLISSILLLGFLGHAADICEPKMTEQEFQSERTTVFYLDIYQGALLCQLSDKPKEGLEAYRYLVNRFAPVIGKNQNILEEYFYGKGLKNDPLNRFMTRVANNFGLVDQRGCQRLVDMQTAFLHTELVDLVKDYEPFYTANLESNPRFARACTFE